MHFDELMARRRMVRHYRCEPIPDAVLQRILGVVRRAPSAGNCRPHRLALVTDPADRARLAAIAEDWYSKLGLPPWISQAPAQIVLGVREESYHERYREPDKLEADGTQIGWPVPFWWFDAGALLMLLQLAAIDAGLVTGFYSPAAAEDLAAIAAVAGFAADVAVAGVITLGFPAAADGASDQS
ncbi:MAG TPA: nitroreductase family protein [Sporichthyaceae bacterium]|jgi:nitroreductase|nr:nitroreductase family protein [Sporichthyaceae bacterium]